MPDIAIPIAVMLCGVFIAAATDLWKFKVYNALTFPLLLSGPIYHAHVNGVPGARASLVGILFAFGVLIGPYLMGAVGAGDVKLVAGAGGWLGTPLTFWILMASCIAAGIYALVLILVERRVQETWVNLQIIWHRLWAIKPHLAAEHGLEAEANHTTHRRRAIPFAAMVALGMSSILLWFRWFA